MEQKIKVQDLYNIIVQNMTPEVALKKLLSSSLIQYEKLKFDDYQKEINTFKIKELKTNPYIEEVVDILYDYHNLQK